MVQPKLKRQTDAINTVDINAKKQCMNTRLNMQQCYEREREKQGRKKISQKQIVLILLKSCYISTHTEIDVPGQCDVFFNNYFQRKIKQ